MNEQGGERGEDCNDSPCEGAGKSECPVFSSIGDLLAHHGRNSPERPAIVALDGTALTYGAFWARLNEIVRELRSFGIAGSDRVAVVLPSGPEASVATIAVAAGAVCVPLHPDFAEQEWRRYFADLHVSALLTCSDLDSASRGVAYDLGIPVIYLSWRPNSKPGQFSLACPMARPAVVGGLATGADDAFMLLTSGTTSQPKLVPLRQSSVCLSAYHIGAAIQLERKDRLINVLPLFHAHGLISGLLAALAVGSSVVCPPRFVAAAFFGWLKTCRPTWYTAVPPIHQALISEARRRKRRSQHSTLRLIRSASSTLSRDVLCELEALFGVPVIETYGMTEAASQIAANPLAHRKLGSVGKPACAEIAVIGNGGREVPAGEHGEIALRGPTITRGYYNNDAANRSAFQGGWFRTGDLGYMDADGYLFLVGRIKKADVINRGGQKVSPAEVEDALLKHPDVTAAAVFPFPHKRLGEDVAAALVLRAGAKATPQKLRQFASESLARFKVPGLIRIVAAIPIDPDGKVIRSELAKGLSITSPRSRVEGTRKSLAPRSEAEWYVAKLWAELLEIKELGVDEDVFTLGADSLTVAQLLSRLRARFAADLSFRDIFDAPSVAELVSRMQLPPPKWSGSIASPALRDLPTAGAGLLSQQQQRIHLLSTLDPIGHEFHVVDAVRLSGALDIDVLEASISAISERHETLRSTFPERLGERIQTVTKTPPRLERVDLRPLPERDRVAAIRMQTLDLLRQPFHIEWEPPIRLQLLKLGEQDHALLIKLHHIITDGWSQRLFLKELEDLYNTGIRGLPANLPELPVQYRQFVDWQRAWLQSPAAEEQIGYWRARLKGLVELPLRTDRPRPETRSGRGARFPLKLSRTLSGRIKTLSRTHNVTLFMTLLAAFQCLLYRYTQHEDIAVGSLIANRNQVPFERLIGMFANAIVLRSDLSGDPNFTDLLQHVRKITLDAYRNQDLPIETILQVLQVRRSLDRNILFQVMFILQKGSSKNLALTGLSADFVNVDTGIARSNLLLELIDDDGRLDGWIEYSTDLFESRTIARMAAHFRTLLESIVANPGQRVSRLVLAPLSERNRVIIDWNKTKVTTHGTFSERFDRQVKYTPDATAISTGSMRLSYRALASRAAMIAGQLRRENIRRDEVVVLLAERGADFLAAMIAVQLAGGAFLPLDPTMPVVRLVRIVQHSGARVVLTSKACAAALQLFGVRRRARPRILVIERIKRTSQVSIRPRRRVVSSVLACIVYTSGSTGIPKGAMIEQRGMFNHLLSKISDLELCASDVVAQTSPQSFVISVWQFLAALMVGARAHVCPDEVVRDPALLVQEISREGITVLQIVPALLREILRRVPNEPAFQALSRLRVLISTGESLSLDLCRDWFQHFPSVPIINAYGATETSDDVATHRLDAAPASPTVPIGRAVANTRLYVLDSQLQPLPIGVAGELYVGGVGVARGYLNDTEQTRHRFLRDPFSKRSGARLYRTGDLARWRADGILECLGRVDRQVKIHGCRVELEEIEYVLTENSKVQSAAVMARDSNGDVQLIAYVVATAEGQPKVNELNDFLRTRLPAHMIPAGYFFLDHMPLTPHGKLNRPALAALTGTLKTEDELVAPRSSTERILARIWADMLEVEEVGIFSNFFDLGGHSLLAGRVLARVANIFGVSLPIRTLFEATTIAALARSVDEARAFRAKEPQLQTARSEGTANRAVSIAQERILGIERRLPGLPQFNLPFAYRLQGPLKVPAFEQSLAEVVRRHESLRMGFAWRNGQPVADIVSATDINLRLVVADLAAGIPTGKRAKDLLLKKAELLAQQQAWKAFRMTPGPLFQTQLLRLGHDDHVWHLVLHHIIVDGWSIGILFDEVSEIYSALVSGRAAELPDQAPQFSDFASWQRWWCSSESASRQITDWRARLRGAEPVFSRGGRTARARPGANTAYEPVHLPTDLVARLNAFGRSNGSTLFITLLTGFKVFLSSRNGQSDICIATIMANRSELWTENVVGLFENTTLIRTRLDPDLSFKQALARVREAVVEAHATQSLPFEILASRLAEEDDVDPASLVQVFFVLQNAVRRPLELRDLTIQSFGTFHSGQSVLPIDHTWLTLLLKEGASGIEGSCAYKTDLFGSNTLHQWMADYKAILEKAVTDPERSVGRLIDGR
jgi:amino acid adenylation domain-containing protein